MQSEYGKLKIKTPKAFGFIESQNGDDIFLHLSDLVMPEAWDALQVGAQLTFDVKQTPKGKRAINVREVLKTPPLD